MNKKQITTTNENDNEHGQSLETIMRLAQNATLIVPDLLCCEVPMSTTSDLPPGLDRKSVV